MAKLSGTSSLIEDKSLEANVRPLLDSLLATMPRHVARKPRPTTRRQDRQPAPASPASADHSVFGAGDGRDTHDISMDSERSDDGDDSTDTTTLNTAGGRPSTDPDSPADQYSQAMRNLE